MRKLLWAVLLSAVCSFGADLAGKWRGGFEFKTDEGEDRRAEALLIIKQDGETLTGTAGPNADQQLPIDKGAVDGSKVTMEVAVGQGVFKFELAVDADHLKGDVTLSAGPQTMKAKMDAMRAAK